MKQLTDEFISEEIRYLDPELNRDLEFETICNRSQPSGGVINLVLTVQCAGLWADAVISGQAHLCQLQTDAFE